MKQTIKVAKDQGAHVQGTISYTLSPVHTLDDFVDLAKELEALDCDSVSIKDMAGLITPSAAYELVSKLKEETDLLVDLHCHCTSGMTQISYYAACQAGVDVLDTAISPLSGGTSQPPTESMVAALQGTPYDTELDLKSLTAIKKYFDQIKEKYLALIEKLQEEEDKGSSKLRSCYYGTLSVLHTKLGNSAKAKEFKKMDEKIKAEKAKEFELFLKKSN